MANTVYVIYEYSPGGGVKVDEPIKGIFANKGPAVEVMKRIVGDAWGSAKLYPKTDEIEVQVQPDLFVIMTPQPVQ